MARDLICLLIFFPTIFQASQERDAGSVPLQRQLVQAPAASQRAGDAPGVATPHQRFISFHLLCQLPRILLDVAR